MCQCLLYYCRKSRRCTRFCHPRYGVLSRAFFHLRKYLDTKRHHSKFQILIHVAYLLTTHLRIVLRPDDSKSRSLQLCPLSIIHRKHRRRHRSDAHIPLLCWLSSSLRKLSRRVKPAYRDLPSHFGPLTTRLCIWHRFQAQRVRATRVNPNLLRNLYLKT